MGRHLADEYLTNFQNRAYYTQVDEVVVLVQSHQYVHSLTADKPSPVTRDISDVTQSAPSRLPRSTLMS